MTRPLHSDESGDPGLATERTALAWQRSTLSLLIIAALALRTGVQTNRLVMAGPVAVVLLTAATTAWLHGRSAYRRRAQTTRPERDRGATHPTLMRAIAAATIIAAAGSSALIVGTH